MSCAPVAPLRPTVEALAKGPIVCLLTDVHYSPATQSMTAPYFFNLERSNRVDATRSIARLLTLDARIVHVQTFRELVARRVLSVRRGHIVVAAKRPVTFDSRPNPESPLPSRLGRAGLAFSVAANGD